MRSANLTPKGGSVGSNSTIAEVVMEIGTNREGSTAV
jgi:hypothetical protein